MGLRYLLHLLLGVCLLRECESTPSRQRREVSNNFPNHPQEQKAYQPPLALGNPTIPVSSSATLQNSYQPPISLIRSNEYQSPLSPPQNPYPANIPRSYQPPQLPAQGSQTYVLPNQPQQHQSHSVQYIPPAVPSGNLQQSYSVYQQKPQLNSLPQHATSYSVQQQPPQVNKEQSVSILSDNSGHSTAERTYNVHPKGLESHVPAQAIHKAPASEISPDKSSGAKEKATNNDEYVVYYYYYYDNDTSANNNLSLNFDDIPSLEGYDNDKLAKEPEKNANARALPANINLLTPASDKPQTETGSSQPRSVGDVYGRAERPNSGALDTASVQNLKPVSNVFRYGSNEVPRFPVLPNFIVTEVQTTMKPAISTPDSLTTEAPTTQSVQVNAQPDLKTGDEADDDDLNSVLDNASDLKALDEKAVEEEPTTTTTTTTTEPPTTTEEPTTTTEKPRRRPSLGGGGRRRFNSNSPSSFSPNRNRQAPSRSTTSTSTSTTTTTSPPTRRSFGSNRIRPRPPIGGNRPRPGARTTEASEDRAESKAPENKAPESTTASTTTSRSRFTSSAPQRRFQSNRSRSQSTSSTSTTTTTRSPSSSVSRSRPTSRPRPNLITRNRPPRPGFLRPRPGSEPEEPETTTVPPSPTEETSPETVNEDFPSTDDESNETDEDNETSEETEEPTTTESSRFSALFRPRNRNALGNRPRPVIGNRPSRT